MISEKCFTEKEEKALQTMRLKVEMAVAAEWIVKDEDNPDALQLVYVRHDDDELFAACTCDQGRLDEACPHAFAVMREVRDNLHILAELARRPAPPPEPAAA